MAFTDDSAVFSISHELAGTDGNLVLAGELDANSARWVDDAVEQLLAEGAKKLIFDVAAVTFIDSSGLRSLIRAGRRTATDQAPAGSVRLRNPGPATVRLLEITGLSDQLPHD